MDTQKKKKNRGLKRKNRWKNLKKKIKTPQYVIHHEVIRKEKGANRKGRYYPKSRKSFMDDKIPNPRSNNSLKISIDTPIRSKPMQVPSAMIISATNMTNNNVTNTRNDIFSKVSVKGSNIETYPTCKVATLPENMTKSIERMARELKPNDCQCELPLFLPLIKKKTSSVPKTPLKKLEPVKRSHEQEIFYHLLRKVNRLEIYLKYVTVRHECTWKATKMYLSTIKDEVQHIKDKI